MDPIGYIYGTSNGKRGPRYGSFCCKKFCACAETAFWREFRTKRNRVGVNFCRFLFGSFLFKHTTRMKRLQNVGVTCFTILWTHVVFFSFFLEKIKEFGGELSKVGYVGNYDYCGIQFFRRTGSSTTP